MKRVLTVQDISCMGKCSLTVALPVISALGAEAVILPTALLSTHTAFSEYTFKDLSDQIGPITEVWKNEGVRFDAIYTGYLGSTEQIDYVKSIFQNLSKPGCVHIVDPAMADNGKLYPAFDLEYVKEMKTLVACADVILPNITEACFLTDTEYKESYTESYVDELLGKLAELGAKATVLTGVSYRPETTGVVVFENGKKQYYEHRKIAKGCHGTGDVYASAFVGALLNGKSLYEAAAVAADYTVSCIEYTQDDPDHWYGVKFEPQIPSLIEMLKESEEEVSEE